MELQYLFAGFAVFWAGLLVYLVLLQARLRALRNDVARLEERLAEPAAAPRESTHPAPARVAPETNA